MHAQDQAILKSLVVVAWADGKLAAQERELIDALLTAYDATAEEAAEIRTWAATPRSFGDLPISELSADDRRVLFSHAALLTCIDGEQSESERTMLEDLSYHLRLGRTETSDILRVSTERAKRLLAQPAAAS